MRLHTLWASVFLLLIHVPRASSQAVALTYDLPEAPVASQQSAPAAQPGTASVSGVALDSTGAPIPAAKIILSARGRFDERTTTSGRDGTYSFTALPPEAYRITIAAPGFDTLTSTEFNVRAGDSVTAPKTRLSVSATTASVDVTASPAQIAKAQVQEQERQRVFGVFQNFYTSYIWKPAPLPTPLKYKLAARTIFDPTTIAVTAGVAGAEQYENTYPGYGPGIAGYGKRFGAAYGDALTARIIGSAVLPSLLHQDPRYFYQGSGGFTARAVHAIASTFITRGDDGRTEPNYSHLGGSLASGAIANLYHPAGSRGVGYTFQTFGINIAGNAAGNLFREFVLRHLEPSVPAFANGR